MEAGFFQRRVSARGSTAATPVGEGARVGVDLAVSAARLAEAASKSGQDDFDGEFRLGRAGIVGDAAAALARCASHLGVDLDGAFEAALDGVRQGESRGLPHLPIPECLLDCTLTAKAAHPALFRQMLGYAVASKAIDGRGGDIPLTVSSATDLPVFAEGPIRILDSPGGAVAAELEPLSVPRALLDFLAVPKEVLVPTLGELLGRLWDPALGGVYVRRNPTRFSDLVAPRHGVPVVAVVSLDDAGVLALSRR